jgi:hypothetical protein
MPSWLASPPIPPCSRQRSRGGLAFTVWNRWLKRTGPGNTAGAFRTDEEGKPLGRAIVVLDGSENDEAARQPADFKRLATFPTTYIFAETTVNGKQAANDAYRRIEALLLGWDAVLGPGERLGFVSGSRNTLEDSPQFEGSVVIIARWRFTGTRQLIPA